MGKRKKKDTTPTSAATASPEEEKPKAKKKEVESIPVAPVKEEDGAVLADIRAWSKERNLIVDTTFYPDFNKWQVSSRPGNWYTSGTGPNLRDAWNAFLERAAERERKAS